MVIRGHSIQLVTNPAQEDYLAKAAGVARFAYNWALDAWKDIYAVHTVDPTVPNTTESLPLPAHFIAEPTSLGA